MKKLPIKDMIDRHYSGDRNLVASCAGVSKVQQVNNWVSKGREVVELKDGGFALLSDKVIIIKTPSE
ncbi:hypothetical protein [Microbulbifer epialgicus]|uniref:Cro/Cl family transcriptional regulator n=1 Tax=Microbulbifer epialgicus TaxID=393907 RepID=A0ABV4NTR1_9GAMM